MILAPLFGTAMIIAVATGPLDDPMGLDLRADAKVPADTIAALAADKEYSSEDPEMRTAKPAVSEILIGY